MNYGISILFRAIPLAMAIFCFGYGAFIYGYGDDGSRVVAGPVVFSLGMICIALFCTAATIIRQIIHTYNKSAKYILPVIGYLAAIITITQLYTLMYQTKYLILYYQLQGKIKPTYLRNRSVLKQEAMDEQGNELVLPKVPFRTPSSSIMFTYPLKSTISDTTIGANVNRFVTNILARNPIICTIHSYKQY